MSDKSGSTRLPRIIYVGDVPVRALTAGPAVLYRLFETYPSDLLMLAEDSRSAFPSPGERLPGVLTVHYRLVVERLLNTRWRDFFGSWFYFRANAAAKALVPRARSFGVEAVVGMAHGYGWLAGYELAQELKVPFHLIVHDDWVGTMPVHPAIRGMVRNRFGQCYREAANRLVISAAMCDSYDELYGAKGTVFYPIRSRRLLHPDDPSLVRKSSGPFTFAFVGHAGAHWAQRMLASFANAIAPLGARLRIHFSIDSDILVRAGLQTDNIEIVAFEPEPAKLQRSIIAGADAMYLPMSFSERDRRNVTLCFPSKTADYTATGLPIMIHAPECASAVVWARENPGVACATTSEETSDISRNAKKIIEDKAYREDLARKGVTIGWLEFAHDILFGRFSEYLIASSQTGGSRNLRRGATIG